MAHQDDGGAIGGMPNAALYERLREADPASLMANELEILADAAWWLSRLDESIAARQHAYSAYLEAGNKRRAGYTAWFLFYDYVSKGQAAAASGWLIRAARHLEDEPECVEQGYLLLGQADAAQSDGALAAAAAFATKAVEIADRLGSSDLNALGLQVLGRIHVGMDDRHRGVALFDEAMTSVLAGELSPFVTGWVYCNVLGACLEIGDLRRAGEWTAAATRWCESLPEGSPYHGLCRLYRVQVVSLQGAWGEAERDAQRASEQLMSFPGAAGYAFYAMGEIRRRRGDLVGAEEAFRRAHELGRDPYPGLALVRLAQGKIEAAIAALETAATDSGTVLERAAVLAALVQARLAGGVHEGARHAAEELTALAETAGSTMVSATAASARGAVLLSEENTDSLQELRDACHLWNDLDLPYEAARTRVLLGRAADLSGNRELAELEWAAARTTFERLGAQQDAQDVTTLLRRDRTLPAGLTERESEVLRLVATGRTNRDIATELFISERTVARHLQNIFTKIGISSRAAATAFAFEHDLV